MTEPGHAAGEAVVHLVRDGLDENGQQRCLLCGKVLADYSPEALANMASPDPIRLSSWPAGLVTEVGRSTIAGEYPGGIPCDASGFVYHDAEE